MAKWRLRVNGDPVLVEANSEEEAIAKAEAGDFVGDYGNKPPANAPQPSPTGGEDIPLRETGWMDAPNTFLAGLANMATFGNMDAIGALAMGPRLGERVELSDYAAGQMGSVGAEVPGQASNWQIASNQINEDYDELRRQSPWLTGIGEGVGAAGATAGLPGVRLLPRTGAGALEGAAYGAGFAEPGDELWSAAEGAAIGAGAAAALPPLVGAIGEGATRGLARLYNGPASPADTAADMARATLARDDIVPESILPLLDEAGPEARLIDISPSARAQAGAINAAPGPARNIAERELRGRQQGQQARLIAAAEENIPNAWGDDYYGTRRDIIEAREAQAAPLYEQARARPVQLTPELVDILSDESNLMRQAKAAAVEELRMEGLGGTPPNSLQYIDAVKRSIDGKINAAYASGDRNTARILTKAKRRLTDEIDRQNPTYARARGVFAGAKELENALDVGRELLKGKKRYAEVAEEIADYTDSEMDTFRIGVIQGIVDAIEDASASASSLHNAAKRVANSERTRELLRVAFPDEESLQRFLRTVENEESMTSTAQRILTNSATAERQAGMAGFLADLAGTGMDAASQNMHGLAYRLIGWIGRKAGGKMTEDVQRELASLLMERHNPRELARLLRGRGVERAIAMEPYDEGLIRGVRGSTPFLVREMD